MASAMVVRMPASSSDMMLPLSDDVGDVANTGVGLNAVRSTDIPHRVIHGRGVLGGRDGAHAGVLLRVGLAVLPGEQRPEHAEADEADAVDDEVGPCCVRQVVD